MVTKTLTLFTLFLFWGITMGLAQRQQSKLMKFLLETKVTTDTNYVNLEPHKLTVRTIISMEPNSIKYYTTNRNGDDVEIEMRSIDSRSFGLSATYCGWGCSYSINPKKLNGKVKDVQYNYNYYDNNFGLDFGLNHIRKYSVTEKANDKTTTEWPETNTYHKNLFVNAFYVFNGKRFSMPASFGDSWLQKKSCGSFITGLYFYHIKIVNNWYYDSNDIPLGHEFKLNDISLSAGYGYNFVGKRHWLLHLSAAPSIVIWSDYKVNESSDPDGYKKFDSGFPLHGVGRIVVNYGWKRYFLGINGVVQLLSTGASAHTSLEHTQSMASMYFGVRF